MILVDTNTWVRHLRSRDGRLVGLLEANRVVCSDVVLGELRLGAGLPEAFVPLLEALPRLPTPSAADTLRFVERHHQAFRGAGVGWADAELITTAAEAGALIHSSDAPLRRVWRRLGFRLA